MLSGATSCASSVRITGKRTEYTAVCQAKRPAAARSIRLAHSTQAEKMP